MKTLRNFFATATTGLLLTGLSLNFNACTEGSPLQSSDKEASLIASSLAKRGGNGRAKGVKENAYPQSGSMTYSLAPNGKWYLGGDIDMPHGSKFQLADRALTPPPDMPWGEDVTISMTTELDTKRNQLIFTFGPHGCRFDPPAQIRLKWKDLGIDVPKLYYIEEDGSYTEQLPKHINLKKQWLYISVDHFSRYAIGAT